MRPQRRLLLAAVLLLVLALVLLLALRRPIGEALFERAASARIAAAAASTAPVDGLQVYLCGSGSPMPDAARAGPCVGILAGPHRLVIDAGAGGPRKLAAMGFPAGGLDQVFLTHLHSDHIDSLGELVLVDWVGGEGRAAPLPVAGPPGVEAVVDGFNLAYRADRDYRLAHHGEAIANPEGYGAEARVLTPPGSRAGAVPVYQRGELTVSVFLVDHAPVAPAFGYRVTYRDRIAVISGDTVYSDNLVRAARGADLLLHEALAPAMVKTLRDALSREGIGNTARIMHDILDYHASPSDAARAAAAAGVDALVLYHLVPPLPGGYLSHAFLGDARAHFDGPLRVAVDGLRVTLPASSDAIVFEELL
ncbi:MBL fold metallo-hydrolase [Pseudohaliea rubra]|uniref:Metallo-beta-lactamase family protein n=1 Tax=Pseudohaliea rubra DSM 19751 TaxID=1265313 RepID=A0A095XV11_9GAMM|nr:MBL fold metallo-hydrolase [Pseudohaliea rubra]KGE03526.1 metallo-beta-lactamase family protein [Pseudohaliea rubra DSM 19751]